MKSPKYLIKFLVWNYICTQRFIFLLLQSILKFKVSKFYKIPILIVLHNNTSFGNDEEHQIALARTRGRPPENAWIGQRMVGPEPNYCVIARGYGAFADEPVTEPSQLKGAFQRAVAAVESGCVALVDVHTSLN